MTIEIPEHTFQAHVIQLCRMLSLPVYHTHDSRRSQKGFPDLVIVGPHRILFRELKTAKGSLRPEQKQWLADLTASGADAGVWRADEWETVQDELKALADRR